MRYPKILLLVISSTIILNAQKLNEVSSLSSIYLEFGGQALFVSVNYDILLKNTASFHFGIGAFPYYDYSISSGLNYLYGNIHYLETGIGLSNIMRINKNIIDINLDKSLIIPNIWIGYRYTNKKKLFKVGLMTVLNSKKKIGFIPGISIGAAI